MSGLAKKQHLFNRENLRKGPLMSRQPLGKSEKFCHPSLQSGPVMTLEHGARQEKCIVISSFPLLFLITQIMETAFNVFYKRSEQ